MSEESSLGIPVETLQVLIDTSLNSTILQAFITGLYTLLFARAIVPLIRQRQLAFVAVLSSLYIAIVLNLAASWSILRSAVVTNDATRDTIALQLLAGPILIPTMANATGAIAILLADCLLVWRCLVLWQRNIWIVITFSLMILAELALLPVYLALNLQIGPHHVSMVVIYFTISAAITTSATSLIIYRIFHVSKRSHDNSRRNIYHYSIEVLVESGLLYTIVIVITGVLLGVQGSTSLEQLGVVQAASYLGAILTPVTGIAPTLITARIVSGHAREDSEWGQPTSRIVFGKPRPEQDGTDSRDTDDENTGKRVGLTIRSQAAGSKTIVNQEKSFTSTV